MRVLSLILIIGGICWGSLSGIAAERSSVPNSRALYHEMALAGTIDYAVFERAIAGYNRMGGHDKDILTVIDFTKPSTEKRLFVIDLKLKKILFISYVAHGRNSGENMPRHFPTGKALSRVRWVFTKRKTRITGRTGILWCWTVWSGELMTRRKSGRS